MPDIVLIVDGMKICSETIWDPKVWKFVDYTDHGTPECADGEGTEALVFMVIRMTGDWKHPIAYVFWNKCSASVQVQLIKDCIGLLHFEGFQVLAIVFDGMYTNQDTAKH